MRATARILVIDDEPIVRQTIERALSPAYEVRSLGSGESLAQTLDPFQPDLIILDICMPLEDGWHLCHRLRKEKQVIPFRSSISQLDDESSVRKGFASGGDFHLSKPFDIRACGRWSKPSSAESIPIQTTVEVSKRPCVPARQLLRRPNDNA